MIDATREAEIMRICSVPGGTSPARREEMDDMIGVWQASANDWHVWLLQLTIPSSCYQYRDQGYIELLLIAHMLID